VRDQCAIKSVRDQCAIKSVRNQKASNSNYWSATYWPATTFSRARASALIKPIKKAAAAK
jgi:hypothetical protein